MVTWSRPSKSQPNHSGSHPPHPPQAGSSKPHPSVVVMLDDPQATHSSMVGAKATNLARLQRDGFTIPGGFCVTTTAYSIMTEDGDVGDLIQRLALVDPSDGDALAAHAAQLRDCISQRPLPTPLRRAIAAALEAAGTDRAYAVRSSATAEDRPYASFAGQHETILNVRGEQRLVEAIQTCMASLFTERAIRYRAQHQIPQDKVAMAVLVQQMIDPEAAGVAFSADPKSGNRHIAVIEAVLGLGQAQVSGTVTPDRMRVDRLREQIIDYVIGDQRVIVESRLQGGVQTAARERGHHLVHVLSDDQALTLTKMVGDVERVFGSPQDIEWALVDGRYAILQSRPITTLFPLPSPPPADNELHVYYSFGHKQ